MKDKKWVMLLPFGVNDEFFGRVVLSSFSKILQGGGEILPLLNTPPQFFL